MNDYKSNKIKILIVEDADDFKDLLSDFVSKHNMETSTASNGIEALEIMRNKNFDIVLSDIKMPEMDGVELLKNIKKRSPELPVILMTGFAHIMETETAHSLGADDFISKPFNLKNLLTIIKKHTKTETDSYLGDKLQNTSDMYFSIPIDDFLSVPVLKYDLYIKLSSYKFIKLADAGTTIDRERIEAYKSKGVASLYISEEDYKLYTRLNIQLAGSISTDVKYKKVGSKIISNINEMISNLVFKKAIDETIYNETKDFCVKTFNMISDNDSLIRMLESIKKTSETELFHSTAVSFVSSLISRQMAWTYNSNIQKLVLGSILHDIGKRTFTPDPFEKETFEMSNTEVKEYEKHPTTGRDILLEITNMSSDIVQTVYEHHEKFNGSGFPNAIKSQQIHPFARVIRIADDFCNYIYPKKNKQTRTIDSTLEIMQGVKAVEYDPDILQAFMKAFNKVS